MTDSFSPAEDSARRAFWAESMDRAAAFMTRMMDYPVEECGEPLRSIPEAAEAAGVEIAFSSTPIVDDVPRIFEVREGIIDPLLNAAREMNRRGWVLKIEDGFRTADMQRRLARKPGIFDSILGKVTWEVGGIAPETDLVFKRVSVLVATVPKVAGHMSGCAVDISVLDRTTGQELGRGGPYLEMSELTPMFCPFVSSEAVHNRARITSVMERHGFVAYPYEFWHYSMGDVFAEHLRHTGSPARYAAVVRDPHDASITLVGDLTEPLHAPGAIEAEIASALARQAMGQG